MLVLKVSCIGILAPRPYIAGGVQFMCGPQGTHSIALHIVEGGQDMRQPS